MTCQKIQVDQGRCCRLGRFFENESFPRRRPGQWHPKGAYGHFLEGEREERWGKVITYTVLLAATETEIKLLTIYDKSEKANITDAEIQELRKANGLG